MYNNSPRCGSLHDNNDDPEVYAWEHGTMRETEPASPFRNRDLIQWSHVRLKHLIEAVEHSSPTETTNASLAELRLLNSEICSLLRSPGELSEIHAPNTEALVRAGTVLRRFRWL